MLISSCTQADNTSLPLITISPTNQPTNTPVAAQTVTKTPEFSIQPGGNDNNSGKTTPAPTIPPPQATPTLESPSEKLSPTPSATSNINCTDNAGYFGDVTIPDGTSMQQNEAFVKTWAIRNEGTCNWGPDYSLIFYGGDQMSGPLSIPMPATSPGEIAKISINLKSPSSGGTFTGFWVFQDPTGKRFGVNSEGIDQIWVKIGVTIFNDEGVIKPVGATPLPSATPSDSKAANPADTCASQQNDDYVQQILQLINNARAQNNLELLSLNSKLSSAAYVHSKDMACNNYVDHTGSDGTTWSTRIKAQNYPYSYASENIYVGNPAFGGTPDGAFTWWMNSQIHRDNILSKKISEIGIGYVFYAKSDYGGYYTLDFAKP